MVFAGHVKHFLRLIHVIFLVALEHGAKILAVIIVEALRAKANATQHSLHVQIVAKPAFATVIRLQGVLVLHVAAQQDVTVIKKLWNF